MFYDFYAKLCESIGKKPSRVALDLGINKSTVTLWKKNGTTPQREILQKIADYFHVTVDYLLNEEQKKTADYSTVNNIISFDNFKSIPIIGTIACGEPILAEENIDGYTQVENNTHADFALRCKGNSMTPTFMDGDVVLIRQQPMVENGQIAAVLIDNEATLKHVYLSDNDIRLTADNPQYAPLVYSGEEMNDVRILGLAIGYTRIF